MPHYGRNRRGNNLNSVSPCSQIQPNAFLDMMGSVKFGVDSYSDEKNLSVWGSSILQEGEFFFAPAAVDDNCRATPGKTERDRPPDTRAAIGDHRSQAGEVNPYQRRFGVCGVFP